METNSVITFGCQLDRISSNVLEMDGNEQVNYYRRKYVEHINFGLNTTNVYKSIEWKWLAKWERMGNPPRKITIELLLETHLVKFLQIKIKHLNIKHQTLDWWSLPFPIIRIIHFPFLNWWSLYLGCWDRFLAAKHILNCWYMVAWSK